MVAQNTFRGLPTTLQLLIRGYEEAKRQRHYLRALRFSGVGVLKLAHLLASGARPALSPSIASAAVKAFEEAEASYRPIKRLLPEMWVSDAPASVAVARQSYASSAAIHCWARCPSAVQLLLTAHRCSRV